MRRKIGATDRIVVGGKSSTVGEYLAAHPGPRRQVLRGLLTALKSGHANIAWDESKHPRDGHGRFADKTGGAASSDLSAEAASRRAPQNESDYVNAADYNAELAKQYVDGDAVIGSSRFNKFEGELPPVGAWKIDNFKGNYGREIEELRRIPIKDLDLPEVREGQLDPAKRGDDVRYAEWLRAGNRPPPINVIQRDDGGLRVADGHRRTLAAKAAGQDYVEGWVSYAAPTGKIDSLGRTMKTGLTFKMAQKFRKTPIARAAQ